MPEVALNDWPPEYWLCGECLKITNSQLWGGTDSTAVCPVCGHEHRDDDSGLVYAGTYFEMTRRRRQIQEEDDW